MMLEKPNDINPAFVTAPKGKIVIDIPEWAQQMGMWWSDDGKSVNYAFYGKTTAPDERRVFTSKP